LALNPYNKYCIDCKKNLTTHALIWLGIFVCEHCAFEHVDLLPHNSFSKVYPKKVMGEMWDDYQLKSI